MWIVLIAAVAAGVYQVRKARKRRAFKAARAIFEHRLRSGFYDT